MDLEDFWEPEVAVTAGIAAVVTAAVASPRVRRAFRQGAVYGLAGLMMAGDRIAGMARGVKAAAERNGAVGGATAPTSAPAEATAG